MTEWQEIKLGEVSEITSSKRIFYSDYVNEGIPFWRSKEVIEKFNRKKISTDLFITPEKYSEIKNRFGVPQPNDILLTSVGTLGIPYLVEDNEHFYFKDGNLTWIRNIDEQRLSPQYLYKWLASQQGRDSLREITIGSTQEALTIVGLKSLNLLLPPLPEQKTIAAVLGSLDDKIDLLHRQKKPSKPWPLLCSVNGSWKRRRLIGRSDLYLHGGQLFVERHHLNQKPVTSEEMSRLSRSRICTDRLLFAKRKIV